MGAFNSILEGSPKATRRGEENVIFPWREIARCFWATSVAKGLFDSVEFLNLRKKSKMYIWKEKVQKNTQMSFGERPKVQVTKFAFEESSVQCCELGRPIA